MGQINFKNRKDEEKVLFCKNKIPKWNRGGTELPSPSPLVLSNMHTPLERKASISYQVTWLFAYLVLFMDILVFPFSMYLCLVQELYAFCFLPGFNALYIDFHIYIQSISYHKYEIVYILIHIYLLLMLINALHDAFSFSLNSSFVYPFFLNHSILHLGVPIYIISIYGWDLLYTKNI